MRLLKLSKTLFRLVVTLFFSYAALSGFAGPYNTDSLLSVIAVQPDRSDKADNLLILGKYYYTTGEYDSSRKYLEKVYGLSSRLRYVAGQADALYLESLICKKRNEYDTSLAYIEKYIELATYLNDSARIAKGYNHLANLHLELSDYDLARYYSRKSISIYLPLRDTFSIVANYNCLGSAFKLDSKFDSAAFYFLQAIKLSELRGDERNLPALLNNLGDVYFNDEQYDLAGNYFSRSLEINEKNKKTRSVALNLLNLGRVATMKKEYPQAMDYYDQAAAIYSNLNDSSSLAEVDNNYGDLYFRQHKLPIALQKFDDALVGFRKASFNKGIVTAMVNKAAVLAEMDRNLEAAALQDSCLKLALEKGKENILLTALWNISDNYYKLGRHEMAFEYLLEYKYIKDTVFSIEKSKAITDLILKYEKEKDQAHILSLEKENLKKTYQRNAYMFSGLGIIVLALFIMVYFRQKAAKDKIIARQKIRQLEEEKKLMAAKLLVEGQEDERKRIATELHDGLGVLLSATKMQFSTILDKSPDNKEVVEKAYRMLEQASSDVRKISHNMMPGLLTKLGFYEAVEDLFEHISDTKGLSVICTIEGSRERLPENKEIMLYRIVQEMVNNTLKHAGAAHIEIRISVLRQGLDIIYSDDGKGFDFDRMIENDSIGLKSIQSRVNFLNGQFSVETSPGKGVKYILQIPS
jgi:two-component system, NarL family, sensor kinase